MILSSFGGVSTTSGSSSTVITPPASSKVVCAGGLVLSRHFCHNDPMDIVKALEMGIADQVWQPDNVAISYHFLRFHIHFRTQSNGSILWLNSMYENPSSYFHIQSFTKDDITQYGLYISKVTPTSLTFKFKNNTYSWPLHGEYFGRVKNIGDHFITSYKLSQINIDFLLSRQNSIDGSTEWPASLCSEHPCLDLIATLNTGTCRYDNIDYEAIESIDITMSAK